MRANLLGLDIVHRLGGTLDAARSSLKTAMAAYLLCTAGCGLPHYHLLSASRRPVTQRHTSFWTPYGLAHRAEGFT